MNMNAIRQFLADEEGATAIEYALIAGVIAAGLGLVATNIGTKIKAIFDRLLTEFGG